MFSKRTLYRHHAQIHRIVDFNGGAGTYRCGGKRLIEHTVVDGASAIADLREMERGFNNTHTQTYIHSHKKESR
jgi:hypothetical protein